MYLIGVDIGTTGTKAILADNSGNIICSSYKEYELIKGKNNIVEQDADDWIYTLNVTVKECLKSIDKKDEVAAISLSAQGGTMVCVDQNGTPISKAMVWMDQRSYKQYEEFLKLYGKDYFYERTGKELSPALSLCKIKWISENDPKLFHDTYKYLTTIDYVNLKLTGNYVIDPSNAVMTQLYNIHDSCWDKDLLELIGITDENLPNIIPSGKALGNLTEKAAADLGLPASVLVISGGHDQYCASIGCGVINPGQIMLSTGTAWAVLGLTDTLDSKNPRIFL